MGYVLATEDKVLPEWLTSNLQNVCDCGYPKENGYNKDGKCTSRRCTNPECPYPMAEAIGAMCGILGIPNIKEGVGMKLIKENKLHNHFEALPIICKDKPKVTIPQLLRLNFIPGVDTGWDAECFKYSTVEELITEYKGNLKPIIREYKDSIRDSEKYFEIVPYVKPRFDPVFAGKVTLSGHFDTLKDRDSFVHSLNAKLNGLVAIEIAKNGSYKVKAHIQEANAAKCGKYDYAKDHNIPIYTPKEFIEYIGGLIAERQGKNK